MQNLKSAEILSEDKKIVTSVKVYQIEGEEVVTVIPKGNGNYIFFHPEEELIIQYSTLKAIFIFKVSFKEIKLIKNKAYYVFKINQKLAFENTRKEKRSYLYKEVVIQGFGETNIANILDISKHGMRIETKKPIGSTIIDLYFLKNNTFQFFEGRIIWEKVMDDSFQYGLNIIQKGGIKHEI